MTEVRKAIKDLNVVVRELRMSTDWYNDSIDIDKLYSQAEELQYLAFELKSMLREGGTWAERLEVK